MTNEEIKRIIADKQTEQLTTLFCHHWNIATRRLEELTKELDAKIETCVEADIYAAVMRMQSAVMALVELNKRPSAYLFSEDLDRIDKVVSGSSIRSSIMNLFTMLQDENLAVAKKGDFADFIIQSLAQHFALPQEEQKAIEQQVSPMQHIVTVCAQYMNPNDLMMILQVFQNMNTDDDSDQEAADYMQTVRKMMDELSAKMGENLTTMMVCLMLLMLLPGLIVSLIKQSRKNKSMPAIFNKELVRVRKSDSWYDYWKNRRDTLRVVNDSCSWNDIMAAERTKVLAELGKVPGALFAKWSTDREAFEAEFLNANLSDDALRNFIFHLTYLYEIVRELDPLTKFGDENIVNNEVQQVGDAVLAAARKLINLVDDSWMPHYETMWKELIENEIIFSHLKVTRKSPHNNLFTARFFCHLVGEMKKRAVFGAHSDNDLAEKLTNKHSVGTFRKNIQEGLNDNEDEIKIIFCDMLLKYNNLAHPKR